MALADRARRPLAADSAADQIRTASTGDDVAGPRLLVVQHCPVTPVGLVGEALVARGARLVTAMPHHGDRLPRSAAGFDGLILLGGPMHAGDDAGFPAFAQLLPLIRRCHAVGKPVFGICLGAQLIARAFGEAVYPFGGLEVGYLPVQLTGAGQRDPLLAGMAPVQRIMQLHEDSFGLPDGAVLLMTNATCANQGFRIGATTYGFQFHLEVTARDAANFPRDCWASMERHYGPLAEVVAGRVADEVAAHFDEGAAFCRTVAGRWLDLVQERRAAQETRRRRAG